MTSPHGSSIFSLRLHFHPFFFHLSPLPILHFILTFFILCSCLPSFLYSLSISPPLPLRPRLFPSPLPPFYYLLFLLSSSSAISQHRSRFRGLPSGAIVRIRTSKRPALSISAPLTVLRCVLPKKHNSNSNNTTPSPGSGAKTEFSITP